MLSDPLVIGFGTTPTFTAGTPLNLRRVGNGKFVCTESPFSLDQQLRFMVTPTVKPVGYSTFRFRTEQDMNVAGASGAQLPDDTLTVDTIIKHNPRSHNQAAVLVAFDYHYKLIRENLVRALNGEA